MSEGEQDTDYTWAARRLKPRVVLYVLLVFLGFMALAEFGFHSRAAVKALLLAAVPSVAGLIPGLLSRTEYKVTDSALLKRPGRRGTPASYQPVFSWDQVDRIVPTSEGFKFYTRIDGLGRFGRFFKLRVLEGHSGEIHVEPEDRERVRSTLASRGLPLPGTEEGRG